MKQSTLENKIASNALKNPANKELAKGLRVKNWVSYDTNPIDQPPSPLEEGDVRLPTCDYFEGLVVTFNSKWTR